MTDPDDDALSWEGDDRLQAPARPAPPTRATDTTDQAAGGAGLVVLGVLAGVALLETVFWVRGVLTPAVSVTVDPGDGSPFATASFVINVAGRVLACAAPVAWFGVVVRLVRRPPQRLAWLLLGALLLLPWPFLLGLR